jgi:hypothetical protein
MTHLQVIFTAAVVVMGAAARAADEPSACSATVERSAQLSASQLFDAVTPCAAEKRRFETTLLLVEGQIRAMAFFISQFKMPVASDLVSTGDVRAASL